MSYSLEQVEKEIRTISAYACDVTDKYQQEVGYQFIMSLAMNTETEHAIEVILDTLADACKFVREKGLGYYE